jgi:4-hydroxybenzoate polyprenyltransferase
VSNLPTVWTNVLAGAALGGGTGATAPSAFVPVALAMSSFYVGGMFLNDAFDREIDAIERPERPIPAGHVSAREVFAIGFGLLALGVVLLSLVACLGAGRAGAILMGALLAGAIVLYDAWHKTNPASPILMGFCRVLVYFSAALATGGETAGATIGGAAVLLAYLIGLTYVAKQENLAEVRNLWPLAFLAAPILYAPALARDSWLVVVGTVALAAWVVRAVLLLRRPVRGSIPRAVSALIAGISLVDAALVSAQGRSAALAGACALGLPLTLLFHRRIAGT